METKEYLLKRGRVSVRLSQEQIDIICAALKDNPEIVERIKFLEEFEEE